MSLVRVRLVGDNVAIGHPSGLRFFYEKIGPVLRECDIAFGNLEWPLTGDARHDPEVLGHPPGHMHPADALALRDAGFRALSTANNHIMDYGPAALTETLDLLDAQGIAHCGSGPDRESARRPAVLVVEGIRVAFLAHTTVFLPGHAPVAEIGPQIATFRVGTSYRPSHKLFEQPGTPLETITDPDKHDLEQLRDQIARAKTEADVVVVSWHWGVSGGYRKRIAYQTVLGRACIDAGASLVVGHHPHVLQGVEHYRDGVICYSLGNFAFWRPDTMSGRIHDPFSVIADAVFDARGLQSLRFIPVVFNEGRQPEIARDERGRRVLKAIASDSDELNTVFARVDGDVVVSSAKRAG